jgi:hypothetical protein
MSTGGNVRLWCGGGGGTVVITFHSGKAYTVGSCSSDAITTVGPEA